MPRKRRRPMSYDMRRRDIRQRVRTYRQLNDENSDGRKSGVLRRVKLVRKEKVGDEHNHDSIGDDGSRSGGNDGNKHMPDGVQKVFEQDKSSVRRSPRYFKCKQKEPAPDASSVKGTTHTLRPLTVVRRKKSSACACTSPPACKVSRVPVKNKGSVCKTPNTLLAGLLLTVGKDSGLLGSSVGKSGFGDLNCDSKGPHLSGQSPKPIPKQYQTNPSVYPHFDSSEDEATRAERKKKAALAKEERVRRRQQQKEEKDKMIRMVKNKEKEMKTADDMEPIGCVARAHYCLRPETYMMKKIIYQENVIEVLVGIHACVFCDFILDDMKQHLLSRHKDEKEVIEALTSPVPTAFEELILWGDHRHNVKVLQKKQGVLFVLQQYRKHTVFKKTKSPVDYIPCPDCLVFVFYAEFLSHRHRFCLLKKKEKRSSNWAVEKRRGLFPFTIANIDIKGNDLSHLAILMLSDLVTVSPKSDDLIAEYEESIMAAEGRKRTTQVTNDRENCRKLASHFKESDSETLRQLLNPSQFAVIFRLIKWLRNPLREEDSKPHISRMFASELVLSLKTCASHLKDKVKTEMDNVTLSHRVEKYLSLFDSMSSNISVQAFCRQTSDAVHFSSTTEITEILPLASDILKLEAFLNSEMQKVFANFKIKLDIRWHRGYYGLLKITAAKILLLNKPRAKDVALLKVASYMDTAARLDPLSDIAATLTRVEKKLCDRLVVVPTPNKDGVMVPILLTPKLKTALDLLLEKRIKLAIHPGSPYVFSTSNYENLNVDELLQKFTVRAKLENPHFFLRMEMHKYIATACQIIAMEDNELDWIKSQMADFTGDIYAIRTSAMEMARAVKHFCEPDGEKMDSNTYNTSEINVADATSSISAKTQPGLPDKDCLNVWNNASTPSTLECTEEQRGGRYSGPLRTIYFTDAIITAENVFKLVEGRYVDDFGGDGTLTATSGVEGANTLTATSNVEGDNTLTATTDVEGDNTLTATTDVAAYILTTTSDVEGANTFTVKRDGQGAYTLTAITDLEGACTSTATSDVEGDNSSTATTDVGASTMAATSYVEATTDGEGDNTLTATTDVAAYIMTTTSDVEGANTLTVKRDGQGAYTLTATTDVDRAYTSTTSDVEGVNVLTATSDVGAKTKAATSDVEGDNSLTETTDVEGDNTLTATTEEEGAYTSTATSDVDANTMAATSDAEGDNPSAATTDVEGDNTLTATTDVAAYVMITTSDVEGANTFTVKRDGQATYTLTAITDVEGAYTSTATSDIEGVNALTATSDVGANTMAATSDIEGVNALTATSDVGANTMAATSYVEGANTLTATTYVEGAYTSTATSDIDGVNALTATSDVGANTMAATSDVEGANALTATTYVEGAYTSTATSDIEGVNALTATSDVGANTMAVTSDVEGFNTLTETSDVGANTVTATVRVEGANALTVTSDVEGAYILTASTDIGDNTLTATSLVEGINTMTATSDVLCANSLTATSDMEDANTFTATIKVEDANILTASSYVECADTLTATIKVEEGSDTLTTASDVEGANIWAATSDVEDANTLTATSDVECAASTFSASMKVEEGVNTLTIASDVEGANTLATVPGVEGANTSAATIKVESADTLTAIPDIEGANTSTATTDVEGAADVRSSTGSNTLNKNGKRHYWTVTENDRKRCKSKVRKKDGKRCKPKNYKWLWSKQEVDAIQSTLGSYIATKRVPHKLVILMAQEQRPILRRRKWKDIRRIIEHTIKNKGFLDHT